MHLATVTPPGSLDSKVCAARGEELVPLPVGQLADLMAAADWRTVAKRADGPNIDQHDEALVWHQPVRPAKTLCVGLNYRTHITESGRPQPAYPTIFAKFPDTLAGPFDAITAPAESARMDWEVELGVVIGKVTRRVSVDDALGAVAGYTIVNDVSMRDWQTRTGQWLQGKNFEATTPVGPWLVTPDEVDHARDLEISCTVGNEVMQSARTSDLLFTVPMLISYISQFTTLRPGDLIATGTPGGVGNSRTPPRFLSPGDTITCAIEGLGEQHNAIV